MEKSVDGTYEFLKQIIRKKAVAISNASITVCTDTLSHQ